MDSNANIQDYFIGDQYAETYGDIYKEKVLYLEKLINYETSLNRFNVVNFEAGLGKSYKTTQIINTYLCDWGKRKNFLVVKRFSKDVVEMEEALKSHNNHFNTVVAGITKENWSSDWLLRAIDLQKVRLVIITHQRYINLCLNPKMREHFINNRQILIIDEKVTFPIYSYNKREYDRIRSYLPRHTQDDFDKVCKLLRNDLIKLDNKINECQQYAVKNFNLERIEKLKEIIYNNLNLIDYKRKNDIDNFLDGLYLWYSTKCLYNAGNISTFNREHKLWKLDNNIILDASASIDGVYNMSGDYKVINQRAFIDHSHGKFIMYDFNSSKTNLKKYEDKVYVEIAEKIKGTLKLGEKLLVVCHKDNADTIHKKFIKSGLTSIGIGNDYNDEDIAINWYGNIIGKNEYSDFNKCWIIGTPNLPYEQYLIHYMQYSMSDSLGHKGKKVYNGRFTNATFKEVQVGYIAAEIYQSIKRIQRNVLPTGEFFIVNNDPEIVKSVLSRIHGAKLVTETFHFKEEEEEQKVHKWTKADELESYLLKLPKGMYDKKKIREAVGIESSNFNKYLLMERIRHMDGKSISLRFNKKIERL